MQHKANIYYGNGKTIIKWKKKTESKKIQQMELIKELTTIEKKCKLMFIF